MNSTDRLIGALGGAGGAMLLYAITSYFLFPLSKEFWVMPAFFGSIGAILIGAAAFVRVKQKRQTTGQQ